jgi:hypothetical protein
VRAGISLIAEHFWLPSKQGMGSRTAGAAAFEREAARGEAAGSLAATETPKHAMKPTVSN